MELQLKPLTETAEQMLPEYMTPGSAAMDLKADLGEDGNTVVLQPGKSENIRTGISVAIPEGYCGFIMARSGLACKKHIRLSNSVGLIDSDYRGELMVSLYNDSDEPYMVIHGDRIAQFMLLPYEKADIVIVDELDMTQRATGGLGSTGLN